MVRKTFLESLMGGFNDLTSGQGASGLTRKAKGAWDGQSTLAKGAIAGGLLGVLLSGNARRLVGTGVKIGGAALIGGLAYKAYEDWKSGASADTPAAPVTLPAPTGSGFQADSPEAAHDMDLRLLQAMVAAAKADGHVTPEERARIAEQLPRLGFGPEAEALITAELDTPLDIGRVAALAHGPEDAAQIYAASLLVVDPEAPAEKGYLAMLAARLNLDPGLVAHLHAKAATLA
jgi:uncharacterized membrane protein YebE (DUF533 family)